MSLKYFEHPSVHPQEDLYMKFYGSSFMHPYKQSGRWQSGPLAWGLGEVLTTPLRKNLPCDETLTILRIAHELNNSSDRKFCLFYQPKYQVVITF